MVSISVWLLHSNPIYRLVQKVSSSVFLESWSISDDLLSYQNSPRSPDEQVFYRVFCPCSLCFCHPHRLLFYFLSNPSTLSCCCCLLAAGFRWQDWALGVPDGVQRRWGFWRGRPQVPRWAHRHVVSLLFDLSPLSISGETRRRPTSACLKGSAAMEDLFWSLCKMQLDRRMMLKSSLLQMSSTTHQQRQSIILVYAAVRQNSLESLFLISPFLWG